MSYSDIHNLVILVKWMNKSLNLSVSLLPVKYSWTKFRLICHLFRHYRLEASRADYVFREAFVCVIVFFKAERVSCSPVSVSVQEHPAESTLQFKQQFPLCWVSAGSPVSIFIRNEIEKILPLPSQCLSGKPVKPSIFHPCLSGFNLKFSRQVSFFFSLWKMSHERV